jgi:ABC-type polysaccharide/polyol phosphate export permease
MATLTAVPTLYRRRLALTVRTPRELLVPLVTPVLFAVIIAPALANIIAAPGARTAYMTFVTLATAGLLIPLMYGLAEVMAHRMASTEAYIGAVPAVAIVPWFLAGALYPITALPHWLAYIARALPLTHPLALLRYGLTSGGRTALFNIWGMTNTTATAALSLAVVCAYAAVATFAAVRIFARKGVQ